MKTLRVLIVTTEAPDIAVGGLSFFQQMLWQQLKKMNIDFRTLYLNRGHSTPSRLADYNVVVDNVFPLTQTPESRSLGEAWSTQQKIQPILEEYQPDIISVHEAWTMLPFYFVRQKVQLTLHASFLGMQHELARTQLGLQSYWEQKIASEGSAAVVLHSQWAVKTHHDYVTKELQKPLYSFPIGIDRHCYPATKVAHPEGKLVVSFFGRATDVAKNFQTFYSALLQLSAHYREQIEPRIYSHPPYPQQLIDQGFQGLGYVQGDAKMQAFAETDVVVMPSTVESFGIVGIEALMSNCALLAPRGLGMDSYLPADFVGINSDQDIAQRLMAFIDDRSSLSRMQTEGVFRKMVDKPEFDAQLMAERYVEVWQRMLAAQNQ